MLNQEQSEFHARARRQRLEKRPVKRADDDASLLWAAFIARNPGGKLDKWSKYAQFITSIPAPKCGCLKCSEE